MVFHSRLVFYPIFILCIQKDDSKDSKQYFGFQIYTNAMITFAGESKNTFPTYQIHTFVLINIHTRINSPIMQ